MDETSGLVAPDQPRPVAVEGGRLQSLDFIRGIAVMGILAANIVAFGQPFSAYTYPSSFLTGHGPVSDWLWNLQFILVDGKMRGLFSLLFGAGIYLFMEKAWARGATRWLQVRRLAILLVFGLIHFFFIWRGDILTLYAVMGFLALPFLRLPASSQMILGLMGYFAGALMFAASMGPLYFVAQAPAEEGSALAVQQAELVRSKDKALVDDAIETRIMTEGGYGQFVGHQFDKHAGEPARSVLMMVLETLPLMLMGMALYRMGLFGDGFDPKRQRLWGWTGLLVGGGLSTGLALWVQSTGYSYWATLGALMGFSPLPRLAMILGLAALLAPIGARGGGWLHRRIAAAGRAAFTNYIGTSVVLMFVFHGWALGLFGKLNRPELYLVAVAVWVLILAWSKPWLDRFRFGPLEWLWRCLTYGRWFALRRS